MAVRLVEEYGSPEAAADSVWALARGNGWYREGERAERFLLQQPAAAKVPPNKAALHLLVAWHGQLLGHLTHDGFEWRWKPRRRAAPVLVRESAPGKLPPFIESLLPEGWLAQVLREGDQREALRGGRRYLSNVSVAPSRSEWAALPEDILSTPLEAFCEAGRFTGRYRGPGRGPVEETFERNLARLYSQPGTPRLSGVQIKAPMCLLADGTLLPALDRAFTHVLKPAGTAGFETLPVVEWLCLELGRAGGFEVPSAALIEMPDGMPPALLVERFDIRRGPGDRRRLALEDFCSVLNLPATARYDSTIERVARGLRPLSTDPAVDLGILFRRAVLAWLIADGDMHLKNVALIRTADAGARAFASVRLAPLYDAVTTRIFPGLAGDRMALKLNGEDDRLRLRDFLTMAHTIGLPGSEADACPGGPRRATLPTRSHSGVACICTAAGSSHNDAGPGIEHRHGTIGHAQNLNLRPSVALAGTRDRPLPVSDAASAQGAETTHRRGATGGATPASRHNRSSPGCRPFDKGRDEGKSVFQGPGDWWRCERIRTGRGNRPDPVANRVSQRAYSACSATMSSKCGWIGTSTSGRSIECHDLTVRNAPGHPPHRAALANRGRPPGAKTRIAHRHQAERSPPRRCPPFQRVVEGLGDKRTHAEALGSRPSANLPSEVLVKGCDRSHDAERNR